MMTNPTILTRLRALRDELDTLIQDLTSTGPVCDYCGEAVKPHKDYTAEWAHASTGMFFSDDAVTAHYARVNGSDKVADYTAPTTDPTKLATK